MAEASLFCGLYGTAEAVPHKDLPVVTQTLQPVGIRPCKDQSQQAEACATCPEAAVGLSNLRNLENKTG